MEDGIARMGDVIFSHSNLTLLRALGLGSCIAVCVYDPVTKTGSLTHVMLPHSKSAEPAQPGKFADTAIPFILQTFSSMGIPKYRLRVAISGGAELFSFDRSVSELNVGANNIEAVKKALASAGLKTVAEDIGGKVGRTVVLDTTTGDVTVRQVGGQEQLLVNLTR